MFTISCNCLLQASDVLFRLARGLGVLFYFSLSRAVLIEGRLLNTSKLDRVLWHHYMVISVCYSFLSVAVYVVFGEFTT